MNLLDMKVYEDGNRVIVAFNNVKPDTKKMIESVLAQVTGQAGTKAEKIQNVVPINIKEEPAPYIPQDNSSLAVNANIPDIDENLLYQQKGFGGYVEAYQYYCTYMQALNRERALELKAFINLHATRMKNTDPATIPTEELQNILKIGLESIFKGKKNLLLAQSACMGVDAMLAMGRPVLEWAYRICVG